MDAYEQRYVDSLVTKPAEDNQLKLVKSELKHLQHGVIALAVVVLALILALIIRLPS